ncbi:MAG TPA: dTDP-4-dehydrorhamnose 3,5-epimerase [Aestuariivirgaceae bacterium]|nr:dTDP-4-dehydrorhamnose 3,5-epimerase [Aestuariivirgaceae bacterium]
MNDVAVEPLSDFPDLKILVPPVFTDPRGTFSEAYSQAAMDRAGLAFHPVQDNHSFSWKAGTIRGLHFQTPPFAQAKLVRVIRGAIYDVAVDIRHGSPTFGRFAAVELSAQSRKQFLIPSGFAHGYCTLTAEAEVLYKVDAPYAPANDTGLLWNDPDLGIPWPVRAEDAVLSDKDAKLSRLKDLAPYFYS